MRNAESNSALHVCFPLNKKIQSLQNAIWKLDLRCCNVHGLTTSLFPDLALFLEARNVFRHLDVRLGSG